MNDRVAVRPFQGSDDEWNALARRLGMIFHSSEWLDVLETSQDASLLRLGVHAEERLVGILPLFLKRFYPLRVAASPMVVEDTPYLGLACEAPHFGPALEALHGYASERGLHFLRLLQREQVTVGQAPPTFVCIDRHTHVLDLGQSVKEMWNHMEGRCRTSIRKAQKVGVTIARETHRTCVDAYYEMLAARYQEQRMVAPNSRDFFLKLWDVFADRSLALLTARFEGRLIAGAIVLVDGPTAYYLNGCSLTAYNRVNANQLIQWEALQLAKSLGALRYDFVGSDIPRLAAFKKSFGGRLVTYSLLESASSRWVSMLRRGFPMMKQVRGSLRSRLRSTSHRQAPRSPSSEGSSESDIPRPAD